MEKNYDTIIIGGGIAGLYTMFKTLQTKPKTTILLLEKEGMLGGRIHTYHDKIFDVEAGAGRFHKGHRQLISLIGELGLENKITSIDYKTEKTENEIHLDELLKHVIKASKKERMTTLINHSFLDYAQRVILPEDVKFIKDWFGYYAELSIMNAHDSIYLIEEHLSGKHPFYVLSGGLSQIIDELHKRIRKYPGARILKNHSVENILLTTVGEDVFDGFEVNCKTNYTTNSIKKYFSKKCICALPKQVIEKIPIFKSIKHMLSDIQCSPLCRIYSKFPTTIENNTIKSWFHGISKMSINNKLRMVIPINEEKGIIMSSYTDNKYAEYWQNLYEKEGEEGMNRELMKLLQKTYKKEIPPPIKSQIFYWSCGVGYWGIGADSEVISKQIRQPFKGLELYICGEHYSEKQQQWIEGALETAAYVVKKTTKK
jgi:monoamine oxidase